MAARNSASRRRTWAVVKADTCTEVKPAMAAVLMADHAAVSRLDNCPLASAPTWETPRPAVWAVPSEAICVVVRLATKASRSDRTWVLVRALKSSEPRARTCALESTLSDEALRAETWLDPNADIWAVPSPPACVWVSCPSLAVDSPAS